MTPPTPSEVILTYGYDVTVLGFLMAALKKRHFEVLLLLLLLRCAGYVVACVRVCVCCVRVIAGARARPHSLLSPSLRLRWTGTGRRGSCARRAGPYRAP